MNECGLHVPFAFTVGQTTLPSGTYEVTRVHAQTNVIMVRDALHSVILMADAEIAASSTPPPGWSSIAMGIVTSCAE